MTAALFTLVGGRADIAIGAWGLIEGAHTALACDTSVVRAGIAIIAVGGTLAGAAAVFANGACRTLITIITKGVGGCVDTIALVAGIGGTGITIITINRSASDTGPIFTALGNRTGVAVGTISDLRRVGTATRRLTAIEGAGVTIIASGTAFA